MVEAQQGIEIKILEARERLYTETDPLSLDTEVEPGGAETEGDERLLLGDLVPSTADIAEAEGKYLEAVSQLPADMQPIFRMILKTGRTPKEAAISLGREWTPALERQAQRMKRKIIKKMLE